jgi:hypothetical protein
MIDERRGDRVDALRGQYGVAGYVDLPDPEHSAGLGYRIDGCVGRHVQRAFGGRLWNRDARGRLAQLSLLRAPLLLVDQLLRRVLHGARRRHLCMRTRTQAKRDSNGNLGQPRGPPGGPDKLDESTHRQYHHHVVRPR